jgi:xanthine dehydrogenase molybdenum-binding subunit
MAYTLLGQDFTPPDIRAKVTGQARYAEDFRRDGMLHCRLLTSDMPHARVTRMDATDALAMEGVEAVLTADELPATPAPLQPVLTNEPLFVGDPILAVAARTEALAADAIERIQVDLEPLPFVVDPLDSLFPGGANARADGNVVARGQELRVIKWTASEFAQAGEDQLPAGTPATEWSYGDVDGGMEAAELVLDESFVTACLSHHCMEPRSSMAYWENGKCFVHGSTQSQSAVLPGLASMADVPLEDIVYIAEYCGGGFGSKARSYPIMGVPIFMARKTGRPALLRVNRAEEAMFGSSRPGFQGRIKVGFQADGRISAIDLYIVQQNGPYTGGTDLNSAADAVSLMYQPSAMRYRGIAVSSNTTPTGAQRGPGQNQIAAAVEPLLDKAAKALGIDLIELRRINASDTDSRYGESRGPVTSSYQRETLVRGADAFDWAARRVRSGQRNGSKVTGIGVGQAFHSAGRSGYDGLVRLTPDGKLYIHSGVGNLGTYSHASTSRVAAEVLQCDWEQCEILRGDTRLGLPWSSSQSGSNTSFTHTRTNYVAAMDALIKLKEIAAMDLGGNPDDYDVADETVFRIDDPEQRITYAEAAQRAIELGGRYSGEEVPDNIHEVTRNAVARIAGTGLVGVAKDNLEHSAMVPAIAAGFIEIALDLETGKYEIVDYLGVSDCGTILHPLGLRAQTNGGAVMGFGLAASERHIYDPQNGLPGNVALYQAKLPSYLDSPANMEWLAVEGIDPQNPVGAKGVGEPLQGCAAAALLCAISDALGGHYFNRTPVTPDMIVNAAAGRDQSHRPLQVSTA